MLYRELRDVMYSVMWSYTYSYVMLHMEVMACYKLAINIDWPIT